MSEQQRKESKHKTLPFNFYADECPWRQKDEWTSWYICVATLTPCKEKSCGPYKFSIITQENNDNE